MKTYQVPEIEKILFSADDLARLGQFEGETGTSDYEGGNNPLD